ncbi:MAG: hypothetical protein WBA93_28520 [Microcoleaceae cyanobacterium]
MEVKTGVDLNKLWVAFERKTSPQTSWLKQKGKEISNFAREQVRYFKDVTPENIVEGGKVLIDKVVKRDWGFFKDWVKDAPFVAKAAGLAAAAGSIGVAVLAGTKVVGAVAATSLGKFVTGVAVTAGLSRARFFEGTFQYTEQALNFDWNINLDKFIKQLQSRLDDFYSDAFGSLGSAFGRSAATVVVNRELGSARVRINSTTCAVATLIDPSIENDMINALEDICFSARSVITQIMTMISFVGVRQIAANVLDKPEWADGGDSPFIISEKVEEYWESNKKNNPDYKYLWKFSETFFNAFGDRMRDLLTDEETWLEVVR